MFNKKKIVESKILIGGNSFIRKEYNIFYKIIMGFLINVIIVMNIVSNINFCDNVVMVNNLNKINVN